MAYSPFALTAAATAAAGRPTAQQLQGQGGQQGLQQLRKGYMSAPSLLTGADLMSYDNASHSLLLRDVPGMATYTSEPNLALATSGDLLAGVPSLAELQQVVLLSGGIKQE